MKKSYSKIRHIQEVNQKIENGLLNEQKILNTVRAGIEGAAKNVATRVNNAFGDDKIRKSGKLEGVTQKVKVRSEFLNKQLEFLKTELNEYKTELATLKTENPKYSGEVDGLLGEIQAYLNLTNSLITQVTKIQNLKINYTA